MSTETITVGNSAFAKDWVSSFTSLSKFKEATSSYDWFTDEVLEKAYELATKDVKHPDTDAPAKKKKD